MKTELTNESAMSAIVLLRQIGRDFSSPERAEKFNRVAARLEDAINATDSGDCIPESVRWSLAGIAAECQDQAAAGAIDALLERHGASTMWRIGCAGSASNNEIEVALCARLGPAEDSADPEGYARAAMYHRLGWRDAEAHTKKAGAAPHERTECWALTDGELADIAHEELFQAEFLGVAELAFRVAKAAQKACSEAWGVKLATPAVIEDSSKTGSRATSEESSADAGIPREGGAA